MEKTGPVVSVIVAALSSGGAQGNIDVSEPPAPGADPAKSTPLGVSAEAIEVIEGKMRTIDYSHCLRTAQAGYSRYRIPRRGYGSKETFAKFPDHFKQDRPGPFSNFSAPDRLRDPRINPNPLQQQQMQRMRQMQRERFDKDSGDVQAAYEAFKKES
jgi:hypothetical protein